MVCNKDEFVVKVHKNLIEPGGCGMKAVKKVVLVLVAVLVLTGCASKENSVTDVGQNNFPTMGATQEGYYFIVLDNTKGEHFIYYYPMGAEHAVVLCNKPNCTHSCDVVGCRHRSDSTDCGYKNCDGHISDDSCPVWETGIVSCAGKLYLMMTDGQGVGLYTISKDGSVRERVCTLDENRQANARHFVVSKGYVYYEIDTYGSSESVLMLYRINLNKPSEKELLFEKREEYVTGRDLKCCEEGVFFSTTTTVTKEDNSVDVKYELFQINEDGAENILGRDDVDAYNVTDGYVYYHSLDDGMLYKYNLNTKENVTLYKTQDDMMYTIWYDSKYVYLDNVAGVHYYWFDGIDIERVITVLDRDGVFVGDIRLEDPDDINTILYTKGCDENYFVFSNEKKSWYVYDKKNIGSQNNELIRIWGE